MAHFTTHKLLELAACRNVRSGYVRDAQRAAADNIYTVEHLIRVPLALAREEKADFFSAFAEAMPRQLQMSLEAEIDLWEDLQRGLRLLRESNVTETELDAYAAKVRGYLACHRDVLRLEEEMVTSCLVMHYEKRLDELLTTAASYDLTRI